MVDVGITHMNPSSQSHDFFVGQISQGTGVASQSTHSMTVTVVGHGHTSIGCPRCSRSRLILLGETD